MLSIEEFIVYLNKSGKLHAGSADAVEQQRRIPAFQQFMKGD